MNTQFAFAQCEFSLLSWRPLVLFSMGNYAHRGLERPHHVVRGGVSGQDLVLGAVGGGWLKLLPRASWEEAEEGKELTHGNSVGQAMIFTRGKTIRRVQQLVFEKTGDCVFAA